jgi:uncharacterized GH25 family protein
MRISSIISIFLLLLCVIACDGFTHLKGKVLDKNGQPVEGALVEMKTVSGGRKDETKSKSDGSFSVGFTHAPFNVDLILTVSKGGYKTSETKFKSSEARERTMNITLESAQ